MAGASPTPPDPPPSAAAALFRRAYEAHRAGRRDVADALYRQCLAADPAHVDALHLYGVFKVETGQAEAAVALMTRAVALKPDGAALQSNLGRTLNDLKRHAEALVHCEAAVRLKPEFPAAHLNRALALLNLGRPQAALEACDLAIAQKRDFAEAHNGRGLALAALDRHEDALAGFDRAIALAPRLAQPHFNRGGVLRTLGRGAEAVAAYDRALALRPDDAAARKDRSAALRDLGRPADALAEADRLIALAPGDADAHCNRALLLVELDRPDEAMAGFGRALALSAGHREALFGQARVWLRRLAPGEALAPLEAAVARHPADAEAFVNRAVALTDLGRYEDALADYERAAALAPEHPEALIGQSMIHLRLGRLERGFRLYECRARRGTDSAPAFDPARLWLGETDLSGRRLFVHHEQGFGDTLQFCRYIPLLTRRGIDVVWSVQAPLAPLLGQVEPAARLLTDGAAPGAFDVHCPLMSLALAFGTTLETIPPPAPSLRADPDRRARFGKTLGPRRRPRIGIAWSGNPAHRDDARRSIPFARLSALLDLPVDWVALQTDIRPADAAAFAACGRVSFHGEALRDFADTAALADLMDLVITVDTSLAHLAGAMGKPVWVLLPCVPDWRWLLERPDSPWHPTARLFRQPVLGDWDSVVADVARALAARPDTTVDDR